VCTKYRTGKTRRTKVLLRKRDDVRSHGSSAVGKSNGKGNGLEYWMDLDLSLTVDSPLPFDGRHMKKKSMRFNSW